MIFNNDVYKSYGIKSKELINSAVSYVVDKFKQSKVTLTASSAYGQILYIIQQIGYLIGYYIEDSISELYINEATRASSIVNLSGIAQYRISRSKSATGEIKLTVKDDINEKIPNNIVIIPNYTRIVCENNGLSYLFNLHQDSIIFDMNKIKNTNINIIQGTIKQFKARGTGMEMQSINVPEINNAYIDNDFINVYVNDELWEKYDNFIHIPYQAKGFYERSGATSGIDIFFGNGNIGKIPEMGSEISVEYLINNGLLGILKNKSNKIKMNFIDTGINILGEDVDLNKVFNINVTIPPDFGYNPESIELTKLMLSRNDRLLLINKDYELLLRRLQQFSTIRVLNDNTSPNIIKLFLIPDINMRISNNETYFNVPIDKFKLSENERKELIKFIYKKGTAITGTEIVISEPIIRKYILNIALTIFDDVPVDIIKSEIINKMGDYFQNITRRNRIPKSDLIAIIEDINGVDSVSINIVSEQDELNYIKNTNNKSGLDDFNDIIITDDELPIIRGGWSDRYGNKYESDVTDDTLGAINIKIKDISHR